MSVRISLVVAIAQNGVIGFEGAMPWRLSTDLKRFKAITMNKPVIMGRKTFESIGRPLPGRLNVIVSRSGFEAEGTSTTDSLEAAITLSREWAKDNSADEICIVGGGHIYRQSIDLADKLYVTHVRVKPDGDTRFPTIEEADWHVISSERTGEGENDSAETLFVVYERNSDASKPFGH